MSTFGMGGVAVSRRFKCLQKPLMELQAFPLRLQRCAFFLASPSPISHTPSQILTTSLDGKCRQYDIRAGKLRIDDIGPSVMNGCYSHDGNCILTSTLDSRVRLFDKAEGELLNEYKGHVNDQYRTQSCLSFDDSLVISGSEDHDVYIWDLLEAELRETLKGHSHGTSFGLLFFSHGITDIVVSGGVCCVFTGGARVVYWFH